MKLTIERKADVGAAAAKALFVCETGIAKFCFEGLLRAASDVEKLKLRCP